MASRETFWNCLSNAGVASLYFWKIMYWICCDRYEQVSFEVLGRVPCNVGEIPSNPWPQEWLLPEFRVQKVAQNLSMKLELWLASQSEKVPWVSAGCHNEMCLPSLRALPHRRRFQWAFTGVSDGDNQVFLMPSISQSTRGCSLSYSYCLRLRSLCLKAKDASYAAQLFLPPQQPGWPHLLPCPIAPEARLRPVLSLLFSSQTQF